MLEMRAHRRIRDRCRETCVPREDSMRTHVGRFVLAMLVLSFSNAGRVVHARVPPPSAPEVVVRSMNAWGNHGGDHATRLATAAAQFHQDLPTEIGLIG